MIRKVLPIFAAIAIAVLAIGPGRQYLPGVLRLQTTGALVSNGDVPMDEGRPSGVGLAPAPVTNPAPTAARLKVAAVPLEKAERGYALSTTVVDPSGKPVDEVTVKFYELVELFGTREMFINAATTDGSGIAVISYLPANVGSHQIVARFSGKNKISAGEARMTFEAAVAAPRPAAERSQFFTFTDRVPYAAGLIVLVVWGLIGFALIATARGVMAGAHGSRGKEEIA